MISRWFIFYMLLFTVYLIKDNVDVALIFLLLAIATTDPIQKIEDKIKGDKS